MNDVNDFRKLVLIPQSNLCWMKRDIVPMNSKMRGLDFEMLCLPDSAKWNHISKSPFLHFVFRERYYRGIIQDIRKKGKKTKVVLMLHKTNLLMPVIGAAKTLLRAKVVDEKSLMVFIMNLNGSSNMDKPIRDREISRACLKYGVPESVIADSKFDSRINPEKEIFRFFTAL